VRNDSKLSQTLAERILPPVCELLCSSEAESVHFGCQIVLAVASQCDTLGLFWPPLFEALRNSVGTPTFPVVAGCFAATVRSAQWEVAEPVVDEFVGFALGVGEYEAMVESVTTIAVGHGEALKYRSAAAECVCRVVQEEASLAVLLFFEVFDIMPEEEEMAIPVIEAGLRSPDRKICKRAIALLTKRYEARLAPFVLACEPLFLSAIGESLFDQLHGRLIGRLLELIYLIVEKMNRRNFPCDVIMFELFRGRIGDDGITCQFVQSLVAAIAGKEVFISLMNSFLVSVKLSNPSEIQLFTDSLPSFTLHRQRILGGLAQLLAQNDEEYACRP
jgi:hypothetical protein